jgi:hypothetical protein
MKPMRKKTPKNLGLRPNRNDGTMELWLTQEYDYKINNNSNKL